MASTLMVQMQRHDQMLTSWLTKIDLSHFDTPLADLEYVYLNTAYSHARELLQEVQDIGGRP